MAILSGNIFVVAAGATIYVDDYNTLGPWDGSLDHPYQNITSGLAHASNGNTIGTKQRVRLVCDLFYCASCGQVHRLRRNMDSTCMMMSL